VLLVLLLRHWQHTYCRQQLFVAAAAASCLQFGDSGLQQRAHLVTQLRAVIAVLLLSLTLLLLLPLCCAAAVCSGSFGACCVPVWLLGAAAAR
jgi:hypothetical protein